MSFCSLIKEITPKIRTLYFVLIKSYFQPCICLDHINIYAEEELPFCRNHFWFGRRTGDDSVHPNEKWRDESTCTKTVNTSPCIYNFFMCRVWPWPFGSCFANEEQKKKKIARDVDDIFVTQSGLVRDITNTDCLEQNDSTQGSVFAIFKRPLLTNRTRNRQNNCCVYVFIPFLLLAPVMLLSCSLFWFYSKVHLRGTGCVVAVWLKCCFTSTETVGLSRTGAQDIHLDFHTAPELCVAAK